MATKSQKKTKAIADATPENVRKDCQLQQFTMFDCDREVFETRGTVKCYPVPRIFRVCKGYPAIEVTSLLHYKDPSGEPVLPADYLKHLPRGDLWDNLKDHK
ncbi:hypothetical protein CPB86DRAFT_695707 [Serendipita vermifera]|nr:hypothetical protein CPB86DRAFT_695707 [Serendipita vermifera]